ncbi:DUF2484 family protein [Paracoccus aestuariivivens]|uniref:DUF2484 family protein n=1 Tax=Paracoccus aestuariivivens TaxID=1820333 RepID=A0A6L6J9E5_9RHOB|nr:DUF2484 family protein [Paracoccus aestuariivivens]MTH77287.1 DUF2484 family protein [Paracoccus aestuariivivens]
MIALGTHPGAAALCAAGWLVLACAMPLIRHHRRHAAIWLLVMPGVPLLGWLTYLCGPTLGVLFLALGLSILVWPPLDWLQRRRRRAAGHGAQ